MAGTGRCHLKRENDSLAHQTLHDELTGLPNRKAFEQQLQKLLDDPKPRQQVSVLLSTVEREEQVVQVARDIIEAMQPPISLSEGARVLQSLSVGVALAKNHSSAEALTRWLKPLVA